MSTSLDDYQRIIQGALRPCAAVRAVYIYGSTLHSDAPQDLDVFVVLRPGTKDVLRACKEADGALRSCLPDYKVDINICIDPGHELTLGREDLLPYHMYIANTGTLMYGEDVLQPFREATLPLWSVCRRIASMANRLRYIYLNPVEDRFNKWRKWLIYGLADAELALYGDIDADVAVTAKRFYERYTAELASLADVFGTKPLSLEWYVSAYYALYCHLVALSEQQQRQVRHCSKGNSI